MDSETLKSIMQGHCLTVKIQKTHEEINPYNCAFSEYITEDPVRYILCKSLKYRMDGYWEYQDSLADVTINPRMSENFQYKDLVLRQSSVNCSECKLNNRFSRTWANQPVASLDLCNMPSITSPDKVLVSIIRQDEVILRFLCQYVDMGIRYHHGYYLLDGIEYLESGNITDLIKTNKSIIVKYIESGRIDWIKIEDIPQEENEDIPLKIYSKLIEGIIIKNRASLYIEDDYLFYPFEILFEPYEDEVVKQLENDLEESLKKGQIKEGNYSFKQIGNEVIFLKTITRSSPIAGTYHWYSGQDYSVVTTIYRYTKTFDNVVLAKMVVDFLEKNKFQSIEETDLLFKDAKLKIQEFTETENRVPD